MSMCAGFSGRMLCRFRAKRQKCYRGRRSGYGVRLIYIFRVGFIARDPSMKRELEAHDAGLVCNGILFDTITDYVACVGVGGNNSENWDKNIFAKVLLKIQEIVLAI